MSTVAERFRSETCSQTDRDLESWIEKEIVAKPILVCTSFLARINKKHQFFVRYLPDATDVIFHRDTDSNRVICMDPFRKPTAFLEYNTTVCQPTVRIVLKCR